MVVEDGELIGLRLYTVRARSACPGLITPGPITAPAQGPCFMLYNTVLRGMGNPEQPGVVAAHDAAFGGMAVVGRFVSTLHAVNHGCIKISRLSVTKQARPGLGRIVVSERAGAESFRVSGVKRRTVVQSDSATEPQVHRGFAGMKLPDSFCPRPPGRLRALRALHSTSSPCGAFSSSMGARGA